TPKIGDCAKLSFASFVTAIYKRVENQRTKGLNNHNLFFLKLAVNGGGMVSKGLRASFLSSYS
ncbi:MAG: hypothetical protein JXR48_05165, partial [Candidatus Delongbacteria bacterium]|nr:hypothetical protein [Candidatus Delongbacteria bacterium]